MSDAMTNREIEDVLTSIRRLVSQDMVRPVEIGRLILTESQRITAAQSIDAPSVGDDAAQRDAGEEAPQSQIHVGFPAPDFGKLEATIAELEAAVSASGGVWDAENTEEGPRASNVTALYGRAAFAHRPAAAPITEDDGPGAVAAVEAGVAAPVADLAAEPESVTEAVAAPVDVQASDDVADEVPSEALLAAEDDSAAAVTDAGEVDTVIDEAMLRILVAQMVREELHGELGGRITLQVRKLVRAEIAKALDERKFL